MNAVYRTLFPIGVLACGLVMSMPADAALHQTATFLNPAAGCQLSIPTTDTEVRPKATGFRNESTTKSAFVICGYPRPTADSMPADIELLVHSMDGSARTVNCTAVTGIDGLYPPVYSSKSVSSNTSSALVQWFPNDFGGTTTIPNGYHVSVTCTLPPQTSIIALGSLIFVEIGN